jgi:short-subunit dehydrogenase
VKYHLPQLFYRDKHGVIIVSWNKSNLQKELRRKYLCHQTIIIQKDFDESDLAEELFNEIKEKHQLYIQFLVNNAVTGVRGRIWEIDMKKICLENSFKCYIISSTYQTYFTRNDSTK